jgi:hypothetical protein
MILDLIAILFVIILSFCLCMNDKIKNTITNCQLSHILIGLSVIVFYKLAKYFKIKDKDYNFNNINNSKESFTATDSTLTKNISDFISGIDKNIVNINEVSTLNADQIRAYTTALENLTNKISEVKLALAPPPIDNATDTSNMSSLDISAQQQYQQFQIDYLTKQIQNSQNIINAQTIADSATNYKPIKVFSSCVIANANGTTTVDQPVNPTKQNPSSGSSSISSFVDTLINNTISQSNSQTSGPAMNLSPTTGKLGEVFTNYLNQ